MPHTALHPFPANHHLLHTSARKPLALEVAELLFNLEAIGAHQQVHFLREGAPQRELLHVSLSVSEG